MTENVGEHLNELLIAGGQAPVTPQQAARFADYLSIFMKWNARMNLSAIRDEEGILSRHFVESIGCARALPSGTATLLDFGSGGGFPGVPVAICRPEIAVTLAESQGKKASFLQEAVRVLGLSSRVHRGRAETLACTFDCVTLRAVDHMKDAVAAAGKLVAGAGWLAVLTTNADAAVLKIAAGEDFQWGEQIPLPGSSDRILALASRMLVDSPQP